VARSKQLQQGDVTIEAKPVPAGAQKKGGLVLAEGEVTGHAHRVKPSNGAEAEMLELGGRIFLRILGGDATVVHEEHKPITLPAGEYEIGRVLEYDYDAEEARQVAD
jgi:hypothetical protein